MKVRNKRNNTNKTEMKQKIVFHQVFVNSQKKMN